MLPLWFRNSHTQCHVCKEWLWNGNKSLKCDCKRNADQIAKIQEKPGQNTRPIGRLR
jgi:hypothetical protein